MKPNFTKYQGKIVVVHDSLEDPNDDDLVDVCMGLFDEAKIRLHSGYSGLLVLTDGGEEVMGAVATALGESRDGKRLEVEFSVVSAPAYRRQGVVAYGIQHLLKEAKDLVREYDKDEVLVYCEVVNPYMTGLLTDLGFAPLDYEVFQSDGYWGVFIDPWGMQRNAGGIMLATFDGLTPNGGSIEAMALQRAERFVKEAGEPWNDSTRYIVSRRVREMVNLLAMFQIDEQDVRPDALARDAAIMVLAVRKTATRLIRYYFTVQGENVPLRMKQEMEELYRGKAEKLNMDWLDL